MLSREYVSDSDGESDAEVEQVFRAPSDYKKCRHLKKFHKKPNEEVWLIKVPAGLDIGSLKSLPVDLDSRGDDRSGSSVVTFDANAKKYSLEEQNGLDYSNLSLLVPDESRESLRLERGTEGKGNSKSKKESTSVALERIFTVSEVASIPNIDFSKLRVPHADVVKVEGLKMRHFPTGYDAKDYGVEENEKDDAAKKKRKESQSSAPSSPSKKKHKKDKKDKVK